MEVKDWLKTDLGRDIWKKKYCKNNESFDAWLDRISNNNPEVKELIISKKFIFGGRILSNRGINDHKVTYSNCYVIAPPEDNLEDIGRVDVELMRTYSYGGGCGTDLSKLAPKGAKIRNAARSTSGIIPFMEKYSNTTKGIGQDGRRGALMLSLSSRHPDLIDFIKVKMDVEMIKHANISIRVDDEFMNAVIEDSDYKLEFYRPETKETIEKIVKAKEVFDLICKANHKVGDPGMLFWSRIENWNLLSEDPNFEYAGVNPCAEEPLPAYGSCLLGSINLGEFVVNGEIDVEALKSAVHIAVYALNDVLDEGIALHPLKQQQRNVFDWRQIGLGVMGIADAFIKMKITYGSLESISVSKIISGIIANEAIKASAILASKYGAYPNYDEKVLESEYLLNNTTETTRELVKKYGLRNSQLLTIAPTGTIGTMLDISTGIEPYFGFKYTRMTKSLHGVDTEYTVNASILQNYYVENPDAQEIPKYFITAPEIAYIDRIKIQAAWQQAIDASISSTINLPEAATPEDIGDIYIQAYIHGLKGITIFRDGCDKAGILYTEKKQTSTFEEHSAPKRPKELKADLHQIKIKGQQYMIFIGLFENKPYELFCQKSEVNIPNLKNGVIVKEAKHKYYFIGVNGEELVKIKLQENTAEEKAHALCLSMILRHGAPINEVVKIARKIDDNIVSFSSAICRVLVKYAPKEKSKVTCPECGGEIIHEGGCEKCANCGSSKCMMAYIDKKERWWSKIMKIIKTKV